MSIAAATGLVLTCAILQALAMQRGIFYPRRMAPHMALRRRLGSLLVATFVVLGCISFGCGGKVVFVDGSSGGAGGSGGGSDTNNVGTTGQGPAECVLGMCNAECTKCVGQTCFAGKCDENRICQPPTVNVVCGI